MYQRNVERQHPGCIIFLVDQSRSMTDAFAGSTRSKSEAVATAINRFIGELITTCEKGEHEPRYYFDVGLIGYTTDPSAQPLFSVGRLLGARERRKALPTGASGGSGGPSERSERLPPRQPSRLCVPPNPRWSSRQSRADQPPSRLGAG